MFSLFRYHLFAYFFLITIFKANENVTPCDKVEQKLHEGYLIFGFFPT